MNGEGLNTDIELHTSRQPWTNHWPIPGFVGMFITIIAIFIIVPLFMKSIYANLLLQGCFGLLILSTIYTMSHEKMMLFLGIGLLIPFAVFELLSIIHDSMYFLIGSYGFFIVFILLADFILLRKVLRAPVINTNLIFGAIMVYLLSGILWANSYFVINVVHPNSFHGIPTVDLHHSALAAAYENHFDLLYYSFTVLATLGLGDITPVHHLARSLTVIEAAFGQLFVAIVIAKMVSVWRQNA